jgi:hypothetical protein
MEVVMEESTRHVVILVHGIRTFGAWQDRLNILIDEHKPGVDVLVYKYRYWSIFAFIVPFLRILAIRPLRRFLAKRKAEWGEDTRVDIVAHSFGTHITAWALRGLTEEDRPKIHTLVLCGSVLRQLFPWDTLLGPDGCVRRVVNDCGTKDVWPVVAQWFVIGMGIAGRRGFAGITGRAHGLVNRYFKFGHSGFFTDAFMEEWWLPLLSEDKVRLGPETVSPTPGFAAAWETYADPVKVAVLLIPLAVIAWFVAGRIREAEAAQEKSTRLERDLDSMGQLRTAPVRSERAPIEVLFASAALHRSDAVGPSPSVERLAAQRLCSWALSQYEAAQAVKTGGWGWFGSSRKELPPSERPPVHSPDGLFSIIQVGEEGSRGTAYLLDNRRLRLFPLEPHDEETGAAALKFALFNSAGTRIILGRGWFVEFHDTAGEPVRRYELVQKTKDPLTHVRTLASDSMMIVGDANKAIFRVSLKGEAEAKRKLEDFDLPMPRAHKSPLVGSAVRSWEGSEVVLVHRDGVAYYWREGITAHPIAHGAAIASCALARTNGLVLTAGRDGAAKLWRAADDTLSPAGTMTHAKPLLYAAFSSDGAMCLTVEEPDRVHVWDVASGAQICEFTGQEEAVVSPP